MRDGSLIFLAFMIIFFFAIAYGYFSRTGSGINPRPYGKLYSGTPGANCAGEVSGHDPRLASVRDWSRGCK
jgi:hypothetical protein